MNKLSIIITTLVLMIFSLSVTGAAIAAEADYLLDQETIITGMVEQEGDSFILQAIDGDQYTITGQDLSDLVGKKVQATGELVREENENTLSVNEIIEVLDDSFELYNERDLIVPFMPFEAGHH